VLIPFLKIAFGIASHVTRFGSGQSDRPDSWAAAYLMPGHRAPPPPCTKFSQWDRSMCAATHMDPKSSH